MRNPYKQGIFKPIHIEKYKGTHPIIYRSALELSFMRWVDNNSRILEWGSESIIIPYIKPVLSNTKPKIHRYYPDFNITMLTEAGPKKYLIEVKPARQTQPPKPRKGKNTLREQYTYAVNDAKWKAASAWCKSNNYNFQILTEKDLPN